MPTLKLTDRFVKNAPRPAAGRLEYWDALTPGFGLRVSASGAATWVTLYRVHGKLRRMTLGKLARYSLAEARALAAVALKRADAGEDPALERQLARRRGLEVRTVGELLRAYLDRRVRPQLAAKTTYEVQRIIERDLTPLAHYEAASLRKAIVAEQLDQIAETSPMSARNAFKVVRGAFRWAAGERGLLDHNPLAGLGSPIKDVKRDRVLSDAELRLLWRAWSERGGPFSAACRFMLLTAQRVQECARIRWAELDVDARRWEIAAARVKTRAAHVVPLSAPALAILTAQPRIEGCEFIFTSGRSARLAEGVSALNGWSKAKARMDADVAAIAKREGLAAPAPWRLQDLRRTARTLMSRAGIPFEHAERVLGHVIPGIAGVYDRHSYATEKRAALDRLAEVVLAIVEPPADNVVSIAAARASA